MVRDAQSRRSNRSQFSFDKTIVNEGIPDQAGEDVRTLAVNIFGVGRAIGLERLPALVDQRVEMAQYRAPPDTPTCVLFQLAIPKAGAFVRVNDLEALSSDSLGLRYFRSDEKEWALTP
jgi:hypothetical protein